MTEFVKGPHGWGYREGNHFIEVDGPKPEPQSEVSKNWSFGHWVVTVLLCSALAFIVFATVFYNGETMRGALRALGIDW